MVMAIPATADEITSNQSLFDTLNKPTNTKDVTMKKRTINICPSSNPKLNANKGVSMLCSLPSRLFK